MFRRRKPRCGLPGLEVLHVFVSIPVSLRVATARELLLRKLGISGIRHSVRDSVSQDHFVESVLMVIGDV